MKYLKLFYVTQMDERTWAMSLFHRAFPTNSHFQLKNLKK